MLSLTVLTLTLVGGLQGAATADEIPPPCRFDNPPGVTVDPFTLTIGIDAQFTLSCFPVPYG